MKALDSMESLMRENQFVQKEGGCGHGDHGHDVGDGVHVGHLHRARFIVQHLPADFLTILIPIVQLLTLGVGVVTTASPSQELHSDLFCAKIYQR